MTKEIRKCGDPQCECRHLGVEHATEEEVNSGVDTPAIPASLAGKEDWREEFREKFLMKGSDCTWESLPSVIEVEDFIEKIQQEAYEQGYKDRAREDQLTRKAASDYVKKYHGYVIKRTDNG